MQESQSLPDVRATELEIEGTSHVPAWLVFFYAALLTWSVWNVFKYWD